MGIIMSHVSVWNTVLKVTVVTVFIVRSDSSFVLQVWLNRFIYSRVSVMTGPGSSVGIVTGYGLDGPGIESE